MARTIDQNIPVTNMRGEPIPQGKVSFEEFLEWVDEDTHAEWVNGEIEMTSPTSYPHQDVKGFLEGIIRSYMDFRQSGKVLSSGFVMRLPDSGREPDLLFVSTANLNRFRHTYLAGPADLAVEIISPESVTRDRQTKFAEYAVGGVNEYWLIDVINHQAEFYQLDAHNQYQRVLPDAESTYHSIAIPGFWLKVDWLWQNPLPDGNLTLLEIGGIGYAQYLIENLRQKGFLPPA